jgi:hypothetical protein
MATIVRRSSMATGQKYQNGMLEGFLAGRGVYAFEQARVTDNPKAMREYLDACIAFGDALKLYEAEGDGPEVQRLTGVGMDATDRAHKLERGS